MTGSARNFLEFHDIPKAGLRSIVARAGELAEAWDERAMPQSLAGVALIVDDGGWRNTTAFDLGIQAMGGICVHVPIGFNTREETGDLSGYLGNWFDMLVIRPRTG
ncbi:ornithine carbamoyltransferase [Rhizobium leguminosarum]|nr:ornithine carbamoyltransferase [Rhizobium leguminosarum]